ncbi:hypothetical protein D3C81_1985320 [compost metagenome]
MGAKTGAGGTPTGDRLGSSGLDQRGQVGALPPSGSADLSRAFHDPAGVSHWFDLEDGQAIEGLLVAAGEEQRVYVVTSLPPAGCESIHGRWPVVSA